MNNHQRIPEEPVFEYQLRFEILVPLLLSVLDREADPARWIKQAIELSRSSELLLRNGEDSGSLLDACEPFQPQEAKRFSQAWRMILQTRSELETLFSGSPQTRLAYQYLFLLYGVRALQRHEREFRRQQGPLGSIWAWSAAQVEWDSIIKLGL